MSTFQAGSSFLGLDVLSSVRIKDSVLAACRGSVLDFTGIAIVNAANERMLGGGGVDGAISDAGGPEMFAARLALPIVESDYVRCRTGDAVTTIGGDLQNKYCIHAVGPNYYMTESLEDGDELLKSAYASVMREGEKHGMKSLAICLLSAGIFRGLQSLKHVVEIAVHTVAANMYPELEYACICAFTHEEVRELVKSFGNFVASQSDDADCSTRTATGSTATDSALGDRSTLSSPRGAVLAETSAVDDGNRALSPNRSPISPKADSYIVHEVENIKDL